MDQPEIILNLWYVCDQQGVISSLRARAYLGTGSDAEKRAFLQQFAATDYLIARSFPVPVTFQMDGEDGTHLSALEHHGASIALFAEALETLQSELPSQTPLEIPDQPLACLTPLLRGSDGNLQPVLKEAKFI
jgi:hypothetical protein